MLVSPMVTDGPLLLLLPPLLGLETTLLGMLLPLLIEETADPPVWLELQLDLDWLRAREMNPLLTVRADPLATTERPPGEELEKLFPLTLSPFSPVGPLPP